MEQVAGVGDARETRADSAQTVIAEWIDRCAKPPPGRVKGQIAKHVGAMLSEGIAADDVRRGLAAWMTKGLDPSILPSVVNEVMNAPQRASPGSGSTKAAGWLALQTGDR